MRWSVALLLLAACVPQEVAVPQPVEMPVVVTCDIAPLPEPAWNLPNLTADASYSTKLRAVLADLELSRGYIMQLQAALAACSGGT